MPNRLKREFFTGDTEGVAKRLLGTVLSKRAGGVTLRGKIVETEAYFDQDDPPSHAAAGRTRRSRTMWGKPGLVYVYLVYGVHYMLNVVTESEGKPGAVLIRAVEPLSGIEEMKENRGTNSSKSLTDGPGKLTQGLGITLEENELDLVNSPDLWIEAGEEVEEGLIERSTRIGVSTGKEEELRFYVRGNDYVSR